MNTDWFFEGADVPRTRAALAAGSTGTVSKLADRIISAGDAPGRLTINGAVMRTFMDSLYADGAQGGDFAVFRLNADADSNAVDPINTGYDVVHGPPAAAATLPRLTVRPDVVALDTFADVAPGTSIGGVDSGHGFAAPWVGSAVSPATVVAPGSPLSFIRPGAAINGGSTAALIEGAGSRANPLNNTALRRELDAPFTGDELFFRYIVRIDALDGDDGNFFMMWLDNESGADADTHNDTSAFLGLRGTDTIFARINSSGEQNIMVDEFAIGDTFTLVGRLSRESGGDGFNRLSFWLDPIVADFDNPAGTVMIGGANGGFSSITHLGFRTGQFTSVDDRFLIDALALGTTFESVVIAPIPEPTTAIMLITTASVLTGLRRRRPRA